MTLPPTPIPPTPTPAPCPGTVPGKHVDQIVNAVSEAQEAYDAVFESVYWLKRDTNLIANERWRTSLGTSLGTMADVVDTLDCLISRGAVFVSIRDLTSKLRSYERLVSTNLAAHNAEGITEIRKTQRDVSDLLREAQAAPAERRIRTEKAKAEREAAAQTARDARAGIATVEGRGTSAERVTLTAGTYEVQVEWSGNSSRVGGRSIGRNFAIWLDGAGLRCNLLVNDIGVSGSESHFCNVQEGTVRIQVEATSAASWSIKFERD